MKERLIILTLLAVVISVTSVGANASVEKLPYLIYEGDPTEMTVIWQMNSTETCTIVWGDTPSFGNSTDTTEYGSDHQHKYTITGLTPGVKYYYDVVNIWGGSFTAAPPDSATSLKFLVYGDTRTYPANQDAVCAQMINTYTTDPAYQTMVLLSGDFVQDGDQEGDWTNEFFNRGYANLNNFKADVPIMGARGNHEDDAVLYKKYFPFPYVSSCYWSFDYGPVHVAVVDQYTTFTSGSTQYNWLANDLATTGKLFKIVMYHEPAWGAGTHSNDGTTQDHIHPLCVQYGVQICVNGHNHNYARCEVNGVQHITTGGGGATLYDVNMGAANLVTATKNYHFCEVDIQDGMLSWVTRDVNGNVIDSFVIDEGPIGPITARGDNPPNETAEMAFDSDVNTKWLDFSPTYSWIQKDFEGANATITEYNITSANDAPERDPMDWNLLGSNNGGASWDTLDTRTGITFATRYETQNFIVSNPGSYGIYRLEITAVYDVGSANSVQIAEIELIGGISGDEDWTNDGGDRAWDNSANWSLGAVPTSADKAAIRNDLILGPIIDSGTTALAKEVVVGDWGSTADTIDITGGSLTTTGWVILAYGATNNGTFDMSAGTATVGTYMTVGREGAGTVSITGGTISVTGTIEISQDPDGDSSSTGDVFLDGGTITAGALNIKSGGLIDITDGTLILDGDVTTQISDYVGSGLITAYSGTGSVEMDYNVTNPLKTTVTATMPTQPPAKAANPSPANGATSVSVIPILSWTAGSGASSHDVYFGTTSPGSFQGNQTAVTFDPGILSNNTTYYWRIDEKNAVDTTTGDVWSFTTVDDSSYSLIGKVMCGYQGWFNCPGDGTDRGWVHWGNGNFTPTDCSVDMWPDMTEYSSGEKFLASAFNDGTDHYVFSSHNQATVNRHFQWMQQYGIDGIFLQRFASELTPGSSALNNRNDILGYCKNAANQYGRKYAVMYDLSGLASGADVQKVVDDWKDLVDSGKVSTNPDYDPGYMFHDGKPVVAVWGLGYDRVYEGEDTRNLIDFLSNNGDYGGFAVMIGIRNNWRSNPNSWFQQTLQLADIILPWTVGKTDPAGWANDTGIGDKNWCVANGKDYMPLIYPGFSWYNLHDGSEPFNKIPREGGQFLWDWVYADASTVGATMLYVAMFDEVDESTAIFKVTNNPPNTPPAQFVTLDIDGYSLPSDEYLWLTGEAGKALRGEITLNQTRPTRTTTTTTDWTNSGGDRLWNNSANWSSGVPDSSKKAAINNNFTTDGPIMASAITAEALQVVIGDSGTATEDMAVLGGGATLNISQWFILGYDSLNKGVFHEHSGTANVGSDMYVGFNGTGVVHMNGGTINIGGIFGIAKNAGSIGDVFLNGGTISSGSFNITSGGWLDIDGGTLIVDGDVTSTINTYIGNGWITGYGGSGTVNVDYNTSNPGKTTVTAESTADTTVPNVVGQAQLDAESNIELAGLSVGSITDESGSPVSSCLGGFNGVDYGDGVDLPTITGSPITEASGLAQSRSGDDLFWVNNDSGDTNRIHAVNKNGDYLGQVVLNGASAVDYEDIATGPGPDPAKNYIYVGDVGDNGSSRTNCRIYRIEEPDISGLSTPFNISANVSVFPISYPDHPWNCETLMVDPDTNDFYLVTKDGGNPPHMYRGTTANPGTSQTLQHMGTLTYFAQLATDVDPGNDYYGIPLFEPDGMIAGDISRSGSEIIIRTHRRAFYWHRQAGESIADAMLLRDPTIFRGVWQEGAGECLCLGTDYSGFYSLAEGANPHMRFYERLCSGLNYVISQDPTGGTIVPYGSSVDMVVSTTPIGASAQGDHPPNETADKAFDSNTGTKWLDFSPSYSWIQWRYSGGATITANTYAITSANDAPERDPYNWNLLGSNDGGTNWDTLDTKTNISFATRFERQVYSVASPGAYNIYRLEITAVFNNPTATAVQLAELEFIESTPDTDPPTPDPMTWSSVPSADSDTAISMTATTATDESGVEYHFIETSGNPGGSDSGWQDSTGYTDSGLNPETQYCYEVQARDKSVNQNATAWSTTQCATTEATPDTTPPTPNPMTWSSVPAAGGTDNISMTATTASDPSGVEYNFDETSGNPGGTDSGWQDPASYTDTGLNASTQYCYRVQARDKSVNQNATAYSSTQCATTDTPPDTTPPTPDPMTWSSVPAAGGTDNISMTATTASDPSGVEYNFDETSGNPGGTDSGWQDPASYTDTGLNASTQYCYRVQARDKSVNQNATAWSSPDACATTEATADTTPPTPDPMTWAVVPYATGTTSISMTATTATDPSGVQYYFTCTVGGGNDSGWQASSTYEDTGLSPETTYTYTVKARDLSANLNETGVSSAESATTDSDVGVDSNWTNGGGDRAWDNASNWSVRVPTSLDKAAIRDDAVSGPIIDSSTTAVANNVVLSDWSSSGDTLDITGGTLTTSGWFIIAFGAGNDGTFNVSGGTTSVGSHMDVGRAGAGHINMTGGSVTVSSTFGIATNGGSGDVQLDGGTISCGSFSMATGATMDITAGTLIVDGNATSTINGYISSGWMTGYGGAGTVDVDYDTSNPGKTTVTATAAGWTQIQYDDFEGGYGNWNDGGSDCKLYTGGTYAHQGSNAINLEDNTSSSVTTTDNLALASYDEVKVDFWYICISMDNENEDFWLQISTNGGSSFDTVEEWNLDDEFVNGQFYPDSVTITGYTLTDQTQIRFRCDASGSADDVYIDEVVISAK